MYNGVCSSLVALFLWQQVIYLCLIGFIHLLSRDSGSLAALCQFAGSTRNSQLEAVSLVGHDCHSVDQFQFDLACYRPCQGVPPGTAWHRATHT